MPPISRPLEALTIVLSLSVAAAAHAQGPLIGVEIERERDRDAGTNSHAVTLKPGWRFAEGGVIDRIELLIEREIAEKDADGERERATRIFLRARHSGNLSQTLKYYVQGGVGRNFNNERDFSYAYIEPGLRYQLGERWEWTLGLREIAAIDGRDGERVHKLVVGPTFKLAPGHDIEVHYMRSTGDKHQHAWSIEYERKF